MVIADILPKIAVCFKYKTVDLNQNPRIFNNLVEFSTKTDLLFTKK